MSDTPPITQATLHTSMGDIVIALVATFIQGVRSDAREAKRADRRSSTELAEYNAYLEQLSRKNNSSQDK